MDNLQNSINNSGGIVSPMAPRSSSLSWLIGSISLAIALVGTYFYWQFVIGDQTIAQAVVWTFDVLILVNTIFVWFLSVLFKTTSKSFSKALLYGGVVGLVTLFIQSLSLLHVPASTQQLIGLASIILFVILLIKIYSISIGKAIGLFIFSGLMTAIVAIILLFSLLFSGLTSLTNILSTLSQNEAIVSNNNQNPSTFGEATTSNLPTNNPVSNTENIQSSNNTSSSNQAVATQNVSIALETKPYVNKTLGIQINPPKGWLVDANDHLNFSGQNEVLVTDIKIFDPVFSNDSSDVKNPRIEISNPARNPKVTFEQLVKKTLDGYSYGGYIVCNSAPLTVNGIKGYLQKCRGTQSYEFDSWLSPIIEISFGIQDGNWSKYEPIFLKSLNTFKNVVSTSKTVVDDSYPVSVAMSSFPATCVDLQEGFPIITSLSSNSVSVGTRLDVRGCNFAGFESDLNVWIENPQGVKGILYGEPGSTSKLISIILKPQACQTDESYRGLPCASYLTLTPGTYKIYTIPWGKKSNVAIFTIK